MGGGMNYGGWDELWGGGRIMGGRKELWGER